MSTILKVELVEGDAYLLDNRGNVWKAKAVDGGIEINIYKIAIIPRKHVEYELQTLARYER